MKTAERIEEFDFEEWAAKFKDRATRDLYAGRSWKRLRGLGFSDAMISLGFYLACDFPNSPGYQKLTESRDEDRRRLARTKRLISRLESDRNEVCELLDIERDTHRLKEPEEGPDPQMRQSDLIACTETISPPATGNLSEGDPSRDQASSLEPVNEDAELEEDDSDFELFFELTTENVDGFEAPEVTAAKDMRMIEAFDAAIAKLRLLQGDLRQSTSKRTSTPTYYLALGIFLIKRRAEQPFYRDYANLLNIANQVFGHDELEVGEDAVRKSFQRFMKRYPDAFQFALGPNAVVTPTMVFDVRNSKLEEEDLEFLRTR